MSRFMRVVAGAFKAMAVMVVFHGLSGDAKAQSISFVGDTPLQPRDDSGRGKPLVAVDVE